MKMPTIIYGTAWKEDRTFNLVKTAFAAGFNAVDVANQPKHYQEHLVGEALESIINSGAKRETLFIQTKFTSENGQDQRIPYDSNADLTTQVKQSFASSLKNLRTDYVDSYLLHGPYSNYGLEKSDWEVWAAIEDIYRSGQTKMIGISNVDSNQLEMLITNAEVKPMVVQNRCFADQGWDKQVRDICLNHDIVYQGFSLLTANSFVLDDRGVGNIAKRLEKTIAQVVFRFAIQIGILPLTGTTNEEHMNTDLAICDFELTKDDLQLIEAVAD
ncbi:MAG: aldo/keto reductase family protein [Candidatus Anammoxibacter sp.]